MKRLIALMLCLILAASTLAACQAEGGKEHSSAPVETEVPTEPEPYEDLVRYETSIGLSLYMTEGFTEGNVEGVQACYEGENANVRFQEETFASLASVGYGDVTELRDYAALIQMAYSLEGEVLSDEYDNVYIYYEVDIQGTSISYYGFFDKGSEAFWMTTFMCMTAQKSQFEEDFKLWASSIQVP